MDELGEKIISTFVNTVWNDGFHEYDSKLKRKEELKHFLNLYADYLIGEDEKGIDLPIVYWRNSLRQEQRQRKLKNEESS